MSAVHALGRAHATPTAPASVFPGLDPARHERHALHAPDRAWPETNCSIDLLIEVLTAKGFEPCAALGFTVAQDFEGDQFTFSKFPAADLHRLYGLEIAELAIFDDLESHLALQVGRGRLPLVELDAFHMPDTRGTAYGRSHGKTTIGINLIDPAARRLDYFHNAGFFRLEGTDYDALLTPYRAGRLPLFPYAEFVKFDVAPPAANGRVAARDLLALHLARRPVRNPFRAWLDVLPRDAAILADRPESWFHAYAFNTMRQAGANFGCLAAHLAWLAEPGNEALEAPREDAEAIANDCKVLQFQMARAAARKRVGVAGELVMRIAERYDRLIAGLVDWPGLTRGADRH